MRLLGTSEAPTRMVGAGGVGEVGDVGRGQSVRSIGASKPVGHNLSERPLCRCAVVSRTRTDTRQQQSNALNGQTFSQPTATPTGTNGRRCAFAMAQG